LISFADFAFGRAFAGDFEGGLFSFEIDDS
jgi:hypothetical protein